ncbi:hypothetical protein FACS189444_2490 [Spirochaetia bacterium]|nr:hypothetical protein FACS189444_2490 [Spirochaetia bacterium]
MKLKKTTSVYILFFVFFTHAAILSAAEENIVSFPENCAFNFSGIYTTNSFIQGESQYRADKPWSIGIGIRYKTTSLRVSVPLYDFATLFQSFDMQSNAYYDALYYEAFCRRYQDFSYGGTDSITAGGTDGAEPDKRGIDLSLFSAGVSAGWIQNSKNHSLSAVYDLDKMQTVSSGSFLLGFGVFYTSIYCTDDTIKNYREEQRFIYFGPTAGYSYTLILPHTMFVNINFGMGLNAGFNTNESRWLIIPQFMPKISFGHHNKSWSINVVGGSNLTTIAWDKRNHDTLLASAMTLTFSKRF